MIKLYSKTLNETIYKEVLDNGLTVYICQKKDFKLKQAIFSVDYGGADIEFIPYNSNEFYTAPLGVAHFLEHKLFTKADGTDIMEDFSKLGCSANAYTSDIRTCYYFSGCNNFNEALILLLDFVQKPHFTDESVENERGIIEQELLMRLDNPYTIAHETVNKMMYEKNYYRNEVGGTLETIKEITKETLDICYNTFYHPKNMCLTVVGDFEIEEVLNLIKENQSNKEFVEFKDPQSVVYHEEAKVIESYKEIEFDVNVPIVVMGLKFPDLYGKSSYEGCLYYTSLFMLIDSYLDSTTDFFQEMIKKGIFNNSFDYESNADKDYCYFKVFCETEEYEEFIKIMTERLLGIKNSELSKEEFEFRKRVYLSEQIRGYESVSSVAFMADALHENNAELEDYINAVRNITYEQVMDARKYFVKEALAVCVINYKKE